MIRFSYGSAMSFAGQTKGKSKKEIYKMIWLQLSVGRWADEQIESIAGEMVQIRTISPAFCSVLSARLPICSFQDRKEQMASILIRQVRPVRTPCSCPLFRRRYIVFLPPPKMSIASAAVRAIGACSPCNFPGILR